MTDETPSLNLIERMAARLAQEKAPAAPVEHTNKAGLIGRLGERIAKDGGLSEPRQVQPISQIQPVAPAEVVRVAIPPTQAAQPPRAPLKYTGKQIKLDFRALRQNGMITPDNMVSSISNEFRGIKRRLLQKVRDPNTRATVNNLIMVTSSLPGEGKTFSSVNLALSLAAERGLQVLLIDADVIRPSVGNVFVSPPAEGLTDLLSGRLSRVSDVLHRCTEVPNLSVIFAGRSSTDSPELLSSGRMVELCREMSSRYPDRVIILDTPPVLASAEPAILANYVHQLVMVVASDQTARHQLRRALESVSTCQSVSLLFNKAPSWNEAEYTAYYGYSAPATAATP